MLEPLTAEERRPLQAWRDSDRKRLLKVSDITLDPIRFRTLEAVSVQEFRAIDWLRNQGIGSVGLW